MIMMKQIGCGAFGEFVFSECFFDLSFHTCMVRSDLARIN